MSVYKLRKLRILNAKHGGRGIWNLGLSRLDAEIVGSNPAQDVCICPCLSLLCWVGALRLATPSSPAPQDSYEVSKNKYQKLLEEAA
jgi:hypothetical protein